MVLKVLTVRANVDVDISDDILDGVDDLFKDDALAEFSLKHASRVVMADKI
jgi:hypothetical protein